MAYRAKRRSTPRRSTRRRMGAVGKRRESATRLMGLVVGAVSTGFINKFAGDKLDPKILGAIEVVGGYLLPTFVKGDLVAGIGDGLIAAGGLNLLHEFGVLDGIPVVAGWRELPTVNGVKNLDRTPNDFDASSHGGSISQMMNSYRRPLDGQ